MSVCIKEFVRGKVSTRNGKQEGVVGMLYACLDETDNTILIGYAKRKEEVDQPDKEFMDELVKDRARVLKTRMEKYDTLIFNKGSFTFGRYERKGLVAWRSLPIVISRELPGFLYRAKSYFQQGVLVEWAARILDLQP